MSIQKTRRLTDILCRDALLRCDVEKTRLPIVLGKKDRERKRDLARKTWADVMRSNKEGLIVERCQTFFKVL